MQSMSKASTNIAESAVIVLDRPIAVPQAHGGALRSWQPGQSGNRAGRKSIGASFADWLNVLGSSTAEEWKVIADDPSLPGDKRLAAKSLLRSLSDAYFNATPLAANDLDRICDRTEGKPTQRVEVAKVERDPQSIMADMAALLAAHPALAQKLSGIIPRALLAHSSDASASAQHGDDAVQHTQQ